VRVKSKMGRFSSSAKNTSVGCGNVDAASVFLLLLQGVCAEKPHSNSALSGRSFPSMTSTFRRSDAARGNAGSGFVTIGDYASGDRERPHRGFAGKRRMASQVDRAGKRADRVDAQEMVALAGERKAGCDAGKGVFELTAGSLAKGALSAGRMDRMSTTVCTGGNERNRVKC
jgi:hypothetical protein